MNLHNKLKKLKADLKSKKKSTDQVVTEVLDMLIEETAKAEIPKEMKV